jgi:hypothetical protein
MASPNATIWVPSALGVVFVVFGVAAPDVWKGFPDGAKHAAIVVAVLLWTAAIFLACRRTRGEEPSGGRGGRAAAIGDDSRATGGRGGDAGEGSGGDGGAAIAKGRRSCAKGGDGGRG